MLTNVREVTSVTTAPCVPTLMVATSARVRTVIQTLRDTGADNVTMLTNVREVTSVTTAPCVPTLMVATSARVRTAIQTLMDTEADNVT
ncbi:hypothetical protein MAR_016657, partial [Mya arenaria]